VSDCEAIRVVVDALVTSVSAIDRRVKVSTGADSALNLGPYDHVINCAWGGRPALDKTAGLHFQGPWTFRMKYFLSATAPPRTAVLPSTTVVLGGFGDLVDYGIGEYYLSWYPSGRLGWSTDLAPPAWPTRPDAAKAIDIANGTLDNLESVIPGVGELRMQNVESPDVHGGLIYSLGNTDVDNPTSEFHRRSDIGPRSVGGYHSMDTGKYTTAPLFAMQVADRVTETG
jgi:hypothetical protein